MFSDEKAGAPFRRCARGWWRAIREGRHRSPSGQPTRGGALQDPGCAAGGIPPILGHELSAMVIPLVIPPGTTRSDSRALAGRPTRPEQQEQHAPRRRRRLPAVL